jgi:hypothetical protein
MQHGTAQTENKFQQNKFISKKIEKKSILITGGYEERAVPNEECGSEFCRPRCCHGFAGFCWAGAATL